MGGGFNSSSSPSSPATDDHSSLDGHCSSDCLGFKLVDEAVNPSAFDSGEIDQMDNNLDSPNQFYENLRMQFRQSIINSYLDPSARIQSLNQAKTTLLSYKPGSWIDKEEGETLSDFDVPKTTTLLLVGPKGSGKSSLINRISRVLEDDKLASDRAQVSYSSASGDETCFLQRYMFPRQSSSFCLFDSRSLSNEEHDNDDMIQSWMTNGVRSGELVIRDSDCSSERASMESKIRYGNMLDEPVRKVNFVIFVVDGLSVLKYMNSDEEEDKRCAEMLTESFNFPYLSFRDDKPVVVVTHGDLLSLEERAGVRIYLGELLGVPPSTQIFDIPESRDPVSESAIVEMLRYALEHADKNLPRRSWTDRKICTAKSDFGKVSKRYFIALIFMVLAMGMNLAIVGRLPLLNLAQPKFSSDTRPTSSWYDRHLHEHSATSRETNKPHYLRRPSMQSTPNQKVTQEPKRESRDRPLKSPKENRSRRHYTPDVSEPDVNRPRKHHTPAADINWEARQRLWLVEE